MTRHADRAARSGRRRRRRLIVATGLAAAAVLLAVGANTLAHYFGWSVERVRAEDLSALLKPYYRVSMPEGPGPYPTALLFSGCDGPRDNMARWSAALNGWGWGAIVVDSHTPRGYEDFDLWRLVCAGQLLMGGERAGDALVAIADARAMAMVDGDRIVLLGSSHGGWTIMDLFALDPPRRLPLSLRDMPAGLGERPLEGVVGSILLYPWCGPANRAQNGWRHPAPVLLLLSANDTIAPPEPCLAIAERLASAGIPVETMVFEGVTHGFDQQDRSPLTTLAFDPEATAEAMARVRAFLPGIAR